jgi:hypothetical protein
VPFEVLPEVSLSVLSTANSKFVDCTARDCANTPVASRSAAPNSGALIAM